jgi:hypothetical protein
MGGSHTYIMRKRMRFSPYKFGIAQRRRGFAAKPQWYWERSRSSFMANAREQARCASPRAIVSGPTRRQSARCARHMLRFAPHVLPFACPRFNHQGIRRKTYQYRDPPSSVRFLGVLARAAVAKNRWCPIRRVQVPRLPQVACSVSPIFGVLARGGPPRVSKVRRPVRPRQTRFVGASLQIKPRISQGQRDRRAGTVEAGGEGDDMATYLTHPEPH